jgi:UDP-N-acetylmuramoyl-tripeptide--D-alanyl-D-alanine ligase
MIHTVLASKSRGTASPHNYNNHVGVPLSILRIAPQHQYAVLELAASGRGEIAALAELAAPKIGVITSIGEAHLASFGSRRDIAQSKGELLAGLPADGRAVLGDDPWLRQIAQGCLKGITWVGGESECDVQATDVRVEPGRLSFRVDDFPFAVPVWGRHHLTSALAAVAVGRLMGLDEAEIAAALARFEPVPMRCEVIQRRGATIINDAYNSNPTAMRAALELLRDFDALGRRIVVFGDMAELGAESARLHRELGREVFALARADLLIACGRYAREVVAGAREAGMIQSKTIYCLETEQSLPYLGQTIQPGDAVLIKGSRMMEMERIVDALETFPRRRSA